MEDLHLFQDISHLDMRIYLYMLDSQHLCAIKMRM